MKEKNKIRRNQLGISLGGFGYNLGAAGMMTYLTYFYTDSMLLSATSVSLILFVSRFIDAFTDLLVGYLIDRTKSRWGRVRPWLLWMAIPAVLSVASMYYVPAFAETGRSIYAFITYNLTSFFYLTALQMPVNTLVSVLAKDSDQRLKINQCFGFSFSLAAVFVNLFANRIMKIMGNAASSYFWYFTICAGIGAIFMLCCFALTKEEAEITEKKSVSSKEMFYMLFHNKYAWMLIGITVCIYITVSGNTVMAYYTTYVLKNRIDAGVLMSVMYIGMAAGVPLFAPLASRIGAAKCCAVGYFLVAISYILLLWSPESIFMNGLSVVLRSLGAGAGTGVMNAIRADVVAYGEWKFGHRMNGLIFSSATFGMKVGSGIGAGAVALFLSIGGYAAGETIQSTSAITAIKTGYIYMPLLFALIITVALLFFDLEYLKSKKLDQCNY